jgi:hypothetical protein
MKDKWTSLNAMYKRYFKNNNEYSSVEFHVFIQIIFYLLLI